MKNNFYFILLTIFFLSSCASFKTFSFTDEDEIMDVFGNLNKTQSQLFIKSQEWLIKNFHQADHIIQFSDKEDGVMMGRYLLTSIPTYNLQGEIISSRDIYAVIDIRVKDDKARISVLPQGNVSYRGNENTIKDQTEDQINLLINDFGAYLGGSTVTF